MDYEEDCPPVTGNLAKVVKIDHGAGVMHARLLDGRTAQWTGMTGDLPEVGDVLLLTDNRWRQADPDAWTTYNSTAIVKNVMEDGTVLLDDGFRIVPIANPLDIEVAPESTVEYNDIDGIVRSLSDQPIRSARGQPEIDYSTSDFLVDSAASGLTFADFGGYPHVIDRARELIETQLKRRDLLDRIGARPVKGILFTGLPGTGKTFLAKIVAAESGAAFFLVSGPSIVSKWVGGSEGTLRRIFEDAADHPSEKAIIFFDEIDSIAERRTGDSHEASKRLVAQLLTLMDGFDDKGRNVVVIAATNRVDSLDPALTRPGRFDWEIEFGLPTLEDRLQILLVSARTHRISDDLHFGEIARATEGWAAAKLTSLWSEAALIAAGDGRDFIAGEDMDQAFERVASRPRRGETAGDTA
ncbi:MAG: ATP-dependent proteasome regulatory subunit [Devosia sp.]|uniref:ATP-binding protein n=1 Tax=Devosia sp. TaxID=1871048 RepID=UPI00260B5A4F|nr:ATP-binding protein [Devosia sp.]MDB5529185.1 ATP-dependent proteasome regulatory subunit [Devosia sp.]